MRLLFVLLFSLLSLSGLFSQTFSGLTTPVWENGKQLLSPWAGGLNAPQWSKADLNGDGKEDLYAFDRDGFVHVPFLNVGEAGEGRYAHAPEFVPNFPTTWNFVLLRDFNKDGIVDYFGHSGHTGIPGFQAFRGYLENGQLKFSIVKFSHWIFDVVTIPLNNGTFANLNVNNVDYPAIDDIDGDGDLDILALDPTSGREINYFRNFALEQGLGLDTLVFKLEDGCWGKIYLPDITDRFLLSGSPDTCAAPFAPHDVLEKTGIHGASTLCTFDNNNDGLKELAYGDLNFPQILFGKNAGSPNNAWMNDQDITFPSYDLPVHLHDFPASFYLDFDNDGLMDMLFSPNEFNISPDAETWFYKNTASNEFPVFNFVKKNAIIEDMIDVGTGASPAFFDYNADGLMDMVIGNFERVSSTGGLNVSEASLYLYKNIGTTTAPAFELVDSDWLSLRQYTLSTDGNATGNFAPAFGDLDQDGDLDLLIGEKSGYMIYVENTAGPGNPATWAPIVPKWNDTRIGNFPTPFIYDLNKDGLADLIVGEQSGNINYLPNLGTPGNPVFHSDPNSLPNNKFLGSVNTLVPGIGSGFSAPVILDFQDTVYLMTGTINGFLELYEVDTDKLEFGDTFQLVTKQFANYSNGNVSRISFADLNNDSILETAIGNRRGGVTLFASPFKTDGSTAVSDKWQNIRFRLFPNPAQHELRLELGEMLPGKVNFQVVNALGQALQHGQIAGPDGSIDVSHLSPGLYFLRISTGNLMGVERFVVQR